MGDFDDQRDLRPEEVEKARLSGLAARPGQFAPDSPINTAGYGGAEAKAGAIIGSGRPKAWIDRDRIYRLAYEEWVRARQIGRLPTTPYHMLTDIDRLCWQIAIAAAISETTTAVGSDLLEVLRRNTAR